MHASAPHAGDVLARGLQLEILARFTFPPGTTPTLFGLNVLNGTGLTINIANKEMVLGNMHGPLDDKVVAGGSIQVHMYVDHLIVTAIVNNRTAITTYVLVPGADSDAVSVFGAGSGEAVNVMVDAWTLPVANNA